MGVEMFDAVAQDVDCAAFVDFALQAGEEFATDGGVLAVAGREAEGAGGLRLRTVEEGGELGQVEVVVAVVVLGEAAEPAGPVGGGPFDHRGWFVRVAGVAGEGGADEGFEAAFGGVGGHGTVFSF